jgi:hypothetical protein
MRIPRPPRWLRSRLTRVSSPRSSRQRRASHPLWRAPLNWSAQTPVNHNPTLQQPTAKTQSRNPAEDHSNHQPRRWRFWVSSIDDDTTLHPPACRTRTRPEIMATPGSPPPPAPLTQHHAVSTPPEARTNSPAPATRERVVLLPHTQTKPTNPNQQ